MKPGEINLALGIGAMILATGLFPSVMIWMLAVFLVAPVALVLMANGVIRSRGSEGKGWRPVLGLFLFVVGLIGLVDAALAGSSMSFRISRPQDVVPPSWSTPWILIRWILPLPFLWVGMKNWTNWSERRRWVWEVIFLMVPVISGGLHRSLVVAGLLPLSA